jgi:hypothetical protein
VAISPAEFAVVRHLAEEALGAGQVDQRVLRVLEHGMHIQEAILHGLYLGLHLGDDQDGADACTQGGGAQQDGAKKHGGKERTSRTTRRDQGAVKKGSCIVYEC